MLGVNQDEDNGLFKKQQKVFIFFIILDVVLGVFGNILAGRAGILYRRHSVRS